MSYIDVTGKTEEEAVAKALAQLGMDRDDVSVEILERAKSGFLGIGSSPARVRVTYGPEEAPLTEPAAAPVKPESKPAPRKEQPARRETAHKEQPQKEQSRKEQPRKEQPRREPPHREESVCETPVEELPLCEDENAGRITAFLSGLLEHLECQAQIRVYEVEKGRYKVILEGSRLGALIGRRGETLDAIQQLTNYAVNSGKDKRIRVQVDAESYRAKREASLVALSRKVAAKVLKYRRSVTLEPMNAYERHVIHAALQDEPGVTTYSIGTEPNRRVVVAYDRGEQHR